MLGNGRAAARSTRARGKMQAPMPGSIERGPMAQLNNVRPDFGTNDSGVALAGISERSLAY